jgi:hypothetical protein
MVWRGENVCLAGAKNRNLPEQGIHQFTKGDEETSVGFCTVDSRQLKTYVWQERRIEIFPSRAFTSSRKETKKLPLGFAQ